MLRTAPVLTLEMKITYLPLFSLLVINALSSCPPSESKNLPKYYGREYFVSSDDDPNPSLATVTQVEQLQDSLQTLMQQVANLSKILSDRTDDLSEEIIRVSATANASQAQQLSQADRLSILEGQSSNVSERLNSLKRTQADETVRLSRLENTTAEQLGNVTNKLDTAVDGLNILERATTISSNDFRSLSKNVSVLCEKVETTNGQVNMLEGAQMNLTERVNRAKSTYTHWGGNTCNSSLTLYSGFMAGPLFSSTGGGSNYLCLPFEPEYSTFIPGRLPPGNRLHPSELETNFPDLPNFQALDQHTPSCSVCEASAQLMLPARLSCPNGWTVNHQGYLMSSANQRTEYICMDSDPKAVPDTEENVGGADLVFVETGQSTNIPGSYDTTKEVTCVVCTK